MDADLTGILDDLAAGRIDAAEANRRIGLAHQLAAQATARAEAERAEAERRRAERDLAETLAAAEDVTSSTGHGAGATGTGHTPGSPSGRPRSPWADLARDLAGAASGLAGSAVRAAAATVQEQVATARTTDVPPVAPGQRPSGNQGIERLVVRATGREVRVVADPAVATITVDGPHRRERSGAVLEVTSESEVGGGLDLTKALKGFGVADAPRLLRGEVTGADLRRLATGRPVVVRVNPAIVVDVETTGCSLHVDGVAWLGRVRITAGAATLLGVGEVEDALVQAATVRLCGRLDGPRSRVRVESGRLRVDLDDHADVQVNGHASLGRITWPTPGTDSHRAGLGTGRLDLDVSLGQAVVTDAREG